MDMIQFLINLSDDIQEHKIDLKVIKIQWNIFMEWQLKRWDFNKYSIKELIEWGENGHNWKQLHWLEEKDCQDYLKEFAGEISYCCDRMSLDRLFRCHWLLNGAINAERYAVEK